MLEILACELPFFLSKESNYFDIDIRCLRLTPAGIHLVLAYLTGNSNVRNRRSQAQDRSR